MKVEEVRVWLSVILRVCLILVGYKRWLRCGRIICVVNWDNAIVAHIKALV
jgi:hypothetical protein